MAIGLWTVQLGITVTLSIFSELYEYSAVQREKRVDRKEVN